MLTRDMVAFTNDSPGESITQLVKLAVEQPDPIDELQELFDSILSSDGRVTIREVKVEENEASRVKGLLKVIVRLEA
jgi:hypothetical protein